MEHPRLKVLIADDEPKVAKLIQALIPWEEMRLEPAGICQDGQSAWDAIQSRHPDIVITDIRMPQLSGLELVRLAAEQKLATNFIIISGYRYFEYAHQALQYGVEEYLLKPIEEEKLIQALEHIGAVYTEKHEVHQMKEQLQQGRGVMNEDFLEAVQTARPDAAAQAELCRRYGVDLTGQYCGAMQIRVDRLPQTPRSRLQEQVIRDALTEMAHKLMDAASLQGMAAGKNGLTVSVLLCWQPEQEDAARHFSHDLMQRLREYFSLYREYTPTLGMSAARPHPCIYAELLAEAGRAVDQRLLLGTNRRIKAAELPAAGPAAEELFAGCRDAFWHGVEAMQDEEACQAVRDCFAKAQAAGAAGTVFYELGRSFLQLLLEGAAGGSEETEEKRAAWYEALYNLTDPSRLCRYLTDQISAYMEEYRKARAKADSMPIREAVRYIRANYAQKIQMDELAARFFFNPTYFSELFKKETGKNFTDYLAEVRMEAAKQLLRDTRLPVHALAEQVGYHDAKYFSQQFIKLVGIKPVEYRRLYQ